MSDMVPVRLNGKWDLVLPEHRASRPEWVPHTDGDGNWKEGWEPERLNAMHQIIRPGDTIIDVGAEEGDMSALCAQWAGPDGAMILIEPNPRVWPNIRAIWEHNPGLAPVIQYFVGFAAAVTDLNPPNDDVTKQSLLTLSDRNEWWPGCAFGEIIGDHGFRHLAQQADATPQIRLDHLLTDQMANVITMDVEGAELEVLHGARDILTLDKPVVFVSVHPEFMRDLYHQHPDELYVYMGGYGYHSKLLAIDHEQHVVFYHPEGRKVPWMT